MTQEDKELLLKDLCVRLPYGLLIDTPRGTFELDAISVDLISLKDKEGRLSDLFQFADGKYWFPIVAGNYKPYLRPMESITLKEESELCNILGCDSINVEYAYFNWSVGGCCDKDDMNIDIKTFEIVVDWLNKKMFDYRGLIEKGLALEAPEDMYKNI